MLKSGDLPCRRYVEYDPKIIQLQNVTCYALGMRTEDVVYALFLVNPFEQSAGFLARYVPRGTLEKN